MKSKVGLGGILGVAIGAGLGVVFHNMSAFIAIGAVVGVMIGIFLNQRG